MHAQRIISSLAIGICSAGVMIVYNVFRTVALNAGNVVGKMEIAPDFLWVFLIAVIASYIFAK